MSSNDFNSSEFTIKVPFLNDQERIEEIRYQIMQILNGEDVPEDAKEALLANEQVKDFLDQFGLGE